LENIRLSPAPDRFGEGQDLNTPPIAARRFIFQKLDDSIPEGITPEVHRGKARTDLYRLN